MLSSDVCSSALVSRSANDGSPPMPAPALARLSAVKSAATRIPDDSAIGSNSCTVPVAWPGSSANGAAASASCFAAAS